MDIQDALLILKSVAGEEKNKLDAITIAIAQLEDKFAPRFDELDITKSRNEVLETENAKLVSENAELKNPIK